MASLKLKDRLAVVTGASRGIGRAAAVALSKQGAHIIAVSRTQGGLTDLDDELKKHGGEATLVPLDVCNGEGIDRLGAAIYERWGKLDILIGNAAILGPLTPVNHLDPKALSKLLDVNLTANHRLIRSLDPLLRVSDAGRAVFVTSSIATSHTAYWGGYGTTKAALEAMVKTYANELGNTSVKANLLDPGPVHTKLRTQAMPGEDPDTLPKPEDIAPLFVKLSSPDFSGNGEVVRYQR